MDIPAFHFREWRSLTVCAAIESKPRTDSTALRKIFTKDPIIARIGHKTKHRFIRMIINRPGNKAKLHVHVDVVSPSFFEKAPPTNSTGDEVDRRLNAFRGREVEIGITARFVARVSSLPATGIVRRGIVETEVAGIKVQQAGAKINITGGIIDSFRWDLGKANNNVKIILEANKRTSMHDRYLLEAAELAESAFETFVKGR